MFSFIVNGTQGNIANDNDIFLLEDFDEFEANFKEINNVGE